MDPYLIIHKKLFDHPNNETIYGIKVISFFLMNFTSQPKFTGFGIAIKIKDFKFFLSLFFLRKWKNKIVRLLYVRCIVATYTKMK